MNRIITTSQIETATVKIEYNLENGTGFFINQNTVVTAFHVFLDREIDAAAIKIYLFDGTIVNASILHADIDNDLCFLKLDYKNEAFLPLTKAELRINDNWNSFGYPYVGSQDGLRLFGTINQKVKNQIYDLILDSSNIESDFDYSGLSGAPIVSSGRVVAIVLKQIDNKIGAISINKISTIFSKIGIEVFTEENHSDIPLQLKEDIADMIMNDDVSSNLDRVLQLDGNWSFLEGNPGTGKTTSIASYEPADEHINLGKYFTKIPNDNKSKGLRISKEYFLNWLEESIAIEITDDLPPKSNESLDVRMERLSQYFTELDEYLAEKNTKGIVFIDGLDEIENLKDFFSILPSNLPANLKFLLAGTSRGILPTEIKNTLNDENVVISTPLELPLCEYYCETKFKGTIDYVHIQKIALKSEGHPLYLHYLINYILSSEITVDQEEFDTWVYNIPSIGGNIENYYNIIWEDIVDDSNKLWICLILCQLRQTVTEQEFITILPEDIRRNFYSVMPKISHLIKDKKLEIYHNSFKDYIVKKLPHFKAESNDIIIKFCEQNPDHLYSISNIVYHYALSTSPENAMKHCTQIWADKLAINNVEPDLIISDIKKVIELSINQQNTTELIRLLLLLQRIDFRYNSVWVEYAFELALALIAAGKYSDALKYLVRRDILLITISDATYFLQHFYENEAFYEAKILKKAIEKEYRKLLNEGNTSGEGIHHSTFISKARTIVLGGAVDLEDSQNEFAGYLNLIHKNINPNAKQSLGLQHVFDHSSSWNYAYLLRYYGIVPDIEVLKNELSIELDETWAGNFATALIICRDELDAYNLARFDSLEDEQKFTETIENLIEQYGYLNNNPTQERLILALLESTKKPELMRAIISEYLSLGKSTELRNQNGVDVEMQNYRNLLIKNICIGYLDDSNNFEISNKQWRATTWESDLLSLIEEICQIEGKIYYYKSTSQLDDKQEFISDKINQVIASINFNFDFRSYWDRAYQLPEILMPEIFIKIVKLLSNFDFVNLEKFLNQIEKSSVTQLGLYSEGYRTSLWKMCQTLLLLEADKNLILPLVDKWEKHVISGVQNRWERTSELLKINEIYSLLGFEELAANVFQEMLNTSMGPTWYKEAQLSLITEVLDKLKSAPDKMILEFATHLDHASGEMTFQRYVRNNKEDFISSLIKNNHTQKAFEYYFFEILPPPNILLHNAEISDFDAPRKGDGYCLGAKNIDEPRGVLEILESLKCNPYLKLALCKIFIVNDDIFRYSSSYSEYIALALNEIECLNEGHLDRFCSEIASIIANDIIEREHKVEILDSLNKHLTSQNAQRLQGFLFKHGINWEIRDSISKSSENPKEIDNTYDVFNKSLEPGQDVDALQKVQEGLKIFEDDNRSIWDNNWSNNTVLAKKNIKSLFADESSVIKFLGPSILKFDEDYWNVCSELFGFLADKLTDDQVVKIYNLVSEHFAYIIRPAEIVYLKYSWITDQNIILDADEQVVNFLIGHLNHPDRNLIDKTFKVLIDLAQYLPCVINSLVKATLSEKPLPSTEISSFVLKELSNQNPELIKDWFNNNEEAAAQISKIRHLTIFKNYLDVSINLNKISYVDLYETLMRSIPTTTILTGKVFLEDDSHLAAIHYEIDLLNEEMFLDDEFYSRLESLFNEYCLPLTPQDVKRSDRYLRRSFSDYLPFSGRYNHYLRHALNAAIMNRVDQNNIIKIYDTLNDD